MLKRNCCSYSCAFPVHNSFVICSSEFYPQSLAQSPAYRVLNSLLNVYIEILIQLKNCSWREKILFEVSKWWIYKLFWRKKKRTCYKSLYFKLQNNCHEWQFLVGPQLFHFRDTIFRRYLKIKQYSNELSWGGEKKFQLALFFSIYSSSEWPSPTLVLRHHRL